MSHLISRLRSRVGKLSLSATACVLLLAVAGADESLASTALMKVVANDLAAADSFGISVAVSGNVAVIGSFLDDDLGNGSGAAYVFTRDTSNLWTQAAKLLPSNGHAQAQFGFRVDVADDLIVVGAPGQTVSGHSNAGSVYVFREVGPGQWVEEAQLIATDPAFGDQVGTFLAISGGTVAAGALFDDEAGVSNTGSVYIFRETVSGVWNQQARLLASDRQNGDLFGAAVDIFGDSLVVGAPARNAPGAVDAGGAYVFRRDGLGVWSEVATLVPVDVSAGDQFGGSVGIHGTVVAVGASLDDDLGANSGSAYVFVEDSVTGWGQEAKLVASDGASGDAFGQAVAIYAGRAVIGAPGDDDKGSGSGAAFVFEKSSGVWVEAEKLVPDDGAAGDGFGSYVEVYEDTLAIGSPSDDSPGLNSGSAYFGLLPGCREPSAIDYLGYTAESCALPQNSVTVLDQTELDAYMSDFGFDGTHVRNLIVKFNPTGDVNIVSPCDVKMAGANGYLDIHADRVCVYGRRGVTVAEDHGNLDQGIDAGEVLLVSEEGSAGFSRGLTLTAGTIGVVAEKEAMIGLSCTVAADSIELISTGDTLSSNASIRQGSQVTAESLLLQASRTAMLGPGVVVSVVDDLTILSTGSTLKSIAAIEQGAAVHAGSLSQVSGNKVTVGKNAFIEGQSTVELDAAGNCSIAATAVIIGNPLAGNCLN